MTTTKRIRSAGASRHLPSVLPHLSLSVLPACSPVCSISAEISNSRASVRSAVSAANLFGVRDHRQRLPLDGEPRLGAEPRLAVSPATDDPQHLFSRAAGQKRKELGDEVPSVVGLSAFRGGRRQWLAETLPGQLSVGKGLGQPFGIGLSRNVHSEGRITQGFSYPVGLTPRTPDRSGRSRVRPSPLLSIPLARRTFEGNRPPSRMPSPSATARGGRPLSVQSSITVEIEERSLNLDTLSAIWLLSDEVAQSTQRSMSVSPMESSPIFDMMSGVRT